MYALSTAFRKDRQAQISLHKSSEIQLNNFSELAICDNSSLTLNKNAVFQIFDTSGFYLQKSSAVVLLGDTLVTVRRSIVTIGSNDGTTKLTLFAGSMLTITDAKVEFRYWSHVMLMPKVSFNLLAGSKFTGSAVNFVIGQGTNFTTTNSTVLHNATIVTTSNCLIEMNNEFIMAEKSLMKFEDSSKFKGDQSASLAIYNSSLTLSKHSTIKMASGSIFILRSSSLSMSKSNMRVDIGKNASLKILSAHCLLLHDLIVPEGDSFNLKDDTLISGLMKCSKTTNELPSTKGI